MDVIGNKLEGAKHERETRAENIPEQQSQTGTGPSQPMMEQHMTQANQ
jgi:hypothetical protein